MGSNPTRCAKQKRVPSKDGTRSLSYYCAIEKRERQKKMDIALASGISTIFGIPIAEVVALDEESD